MKILSASKRLLALLFLSLSAAGVAAEAQSHVVISQAYGGGGNASASYTYDFIELYNPTSAAVDISGYSIQYASATGTSWNQFNFPAGATIASHKYYLIKAAAGTASTPADFTADFDISGRTTSDSGANFTINLAGAAGKVALVNNQTVLSGTATTPAAPLVGTTCPSVNTAAIVDFFAFGSTVTCSEGGTKTAAISGNATSATRDALGTDTDSNGADLSLLSPPVPHNSSYTGTPVAQLGIASAVFSPSSVTAGNSATLNIVVTPGASSTGIAAQADLSAIGGSATQALTAGTAANTFTYTYAVPGATTANTYSIPVSITDQQIGSASSTASLIVQAPVTETPIATIQANRGTYVGSTISTTGVITLVTNAGFYMQTSSNTPGSTGDEGIYIYSGTGRNPAGAVVGNNVTVTGLLTQYPLPAISHTPSLEVTGASVAVNSTGNTLPTPVAIATGIPSATGDIYQLTRYEGMLVTFPSLTAVGPTDGSNAEATETVTSTGQFYTVATGTPRPFREPGMDFRDFPSTTCPSFTNCTATVTAGGAARPANLVLYDDNPERLIVESSLGGGTAIDVTAGAVLANATGVIDFTYATDVPYGDPARLILQPGYSLTNYTPSTLAVAALPLPTANQFTVAAFNVERFFDTNSANNKYYNAGTGNVGNSSAVNVTADAYSRRLKKFSLAVRTVLNNPDIISVEEVENIQVLRDMATQIDNDTTTGAKPGYVAYGTDSTTTYTNDVGGISIGFLVKRGTVNVTNWEQKGRIDTVPSGTTLNDRPSQVLHATINRGAGSTPYPITVISNHLRSLNSIGTDANVRTKKELQAEMLANLIQTYQTAGEHVIAVGDLNAFQFSDGYTDTLGTITGRLSATGTAVQPGTAIVNPAATNLITTLPAAEQQSYTEWGSAQVLDHAIVTADIAATSTLKVGHIDADFPVVLFNDATTPAALSDHDPLLAYLALPAPIARVTLTGTATFPATAIGAQSSGQVFTLTNSGETAVTFTGAVVTGDFTTSNNCPASIAVGGSCAISVVFKPTALGARTGTLTITSSATVAPVGLSGTGTAAVSPDFSLSDSSNATTTTVTAASGGLASATLKFTSTNGFAGNIALTCAAPSSAPAGVSCTVTSPVTLVAGGTATATVTFSTTARTVLSGFGALPASVGGRATWLVLTLLLAGALFLVRRAGRSVRIGSLLALLFVLALGVTGCGGGSGAPSATNPNGTAAGTYAYTVTATSGTSSHSETINLVVQ